jgi:hypothetical protein
MNDSNTTINGFCVLLLLALIWSIRFFIELPNGELTFQATIFPFIFFATISIFSIITLIGLLRRKMFAWKIIDYVFFAPLVYFPFKFTLREKWQECKSEFD